MSKDCRYNGKKCFYYDGHRYIYTTKNDMINKIRKIGFTIVKAKKIANEILAGKNEIVVISDAGEFAVYNTKNSFKEVLRTTFGIKRLSQKKLFNANEDRIKNITIVNKKDLPILEPLKFVINMKYYVSFYGRTYEAVLTDESKEIIDEQEIYALDGKDRRKKVNELIEKGIIKYDDTSLEQVKALAKESEDGFSKKEKTISITAPLRDLKKIVYDEAESWISGLNGNCIVWDYNVMGSFDKTKFDTSKYYVGDTEFRLKQWANIEYLGPWKNGGDSCAVKFISSKYKNLYWEIKKLETKKGITVDSFDNFCRKNNIQYIFKDINGKNIKKFINKETSEFQKNQILNAIIYEKHIYPYSGGSLIKSFIKPRKKIRIENCGEKILEYFNNGIIPKGIKIKINNDKKLKDKKIEIVSFIDGNNKYFENKDYDKYVKILSKIGIKENIPTDIGLMGLVEFIAKIKKCKQQTLSYLPEKIIYKAPALEWETSDENYNINDVKGEDLNKAYSYSLSILPYLIRHDWRKNAVRRINKKSSEFNFVESYLYIIKANEFTSMIPQSGMYPGYHLNKSKEYDINFDVIEELETETTSNYYSEIIEMLYKVMNNKEHISDFKRMMVTLIGIMEKNISKSCNLKFNTICNDEESKNYSGFKQKIGDKIMIFDCEDTVKNVRDQIPINIQIKCKTYELITRRINQMKNNKIIQIKTDAIYFIGDFSDDIKNKENDELSGIWGGWKKNNDFVSKETLKIKYDNNKIALNLDPNAKFAESKYGTLDILNFNEKKRMLYMKYAGNGKTHKIINQYVTKYIKTNEKYLVLTPTHSTLEDYKKIKLYEKHGIKCKILQGYCFDNTIPEEDIIIIDEIGFCGAECHDFIHKLNLANKSIICFGDFNQLLPVGETKPFNQPHYIKYMFNEVDTEFINYRNNFKKEYYDLLINNKINLINEMKKYSTKQLDQADIIICYRNDTRKKMNEEYMKKNKIIPYSEGCKLLCCSNKYKKIGLWNHKEVTIIENNNEVLDFGDGNLIYDEKMENFIIRDSEGKKYNFTGKEIRNNKLFRPAYCINIYEAQGKTFDSFYWAEEDDFFMTNKTESRTAGRIAYTLISRLKQKNKMEELGKLQEHFMKFPKISIKEHLKVLDDMEKKRYDVNNEELKFISKNHIKII